MRSKKLRIGWIALLAIGVLLSVGIGFTAEAKGDSDSPQEDVIPLSGEWAFYWKKWLAPGEFASSNLQPFMLKSPHSWESLSKEGLPLERFGYGTYRYVIDVQDEDVGKNKALFIRGVASAYRIWIDGVEKQGKGTIGKSQAEETPKLAVGLVYFTPSETQVEIVLQVSNYSFRDGGISGEISYGDFEVLQEQVLRSIVIDLLSIGGLFLLGLYLLVVFSIRRHELPILFIGLGSLAVAVRTFLVNTYLDSISQAVISWEWATKLEYLVELAAVITFVQVVKQVFPMETRKLPITLAYTYVAAFGTVVLLTPARIFTSVMLPNAIILASLLFFNIFYVGLLAGIRKREGAGIYMVGLFIVVGALINDILLDMGLLKTVQLLEYSIVVFLLLQAVLISYRYDLLFSKNRTLTESLIEMNNTLEEKVAERTAELHLKNEELTELQRTRTKMLANIAHDLGSPLVGVQANLQLMKDGLIQSDAPNAIQPLLDKITYMNRLNQDLFKLSKLESKEYSFDLEKISAREFIESQYRNMKADLARTGRSLELGRLELTDMRGEEVWITIDELRIVQVLQNYIDNAVKFSTAKDDPIQINGFLQEGELYVEVVDHGKGIPAEELPFVFNRFFKERAENEAGSGLGLAIAKEIIEKHDGRVGVRSRPGEGSTFYFSLPIAE